MQNIPQYRGRFQISFLKSSDEIVSLKAKTRVGSLLEVGETIARIDIPNQDDCINLDTDIVYGENLSQDDKDKFSCIISNDGDIFAPNQKKPTLAKNMQHKICSIP